MRYRLAIILGSCISLVSKLFRFGAGATWPGEIALRIYPSILAKLSKRIWKGVILVAGTNGKTTTSLMIKKILENNGETVTHNPSGANLLNGIVSVLITSPPKQWGVFEVDENTLPIVLSLVQPKVIVLLNLFRDQLDRYGEVDTIAKKWKNALMTLDDRTTLVMNADDPMIAAMGDGLKAKCVYVGLDDSSLYLSKMQHATDSIYCPRCQSRLVYGGVYYSHLGTWACGSCGLTHPEVRITSKDYKSPIEGVYNKYNTILAAAVGEIVGVEKEHIQRVLSDFKPAFGRLEDVTVRGKHMKILLSKNPTGFNESIRTYLSSALRGPLFLALNDRIPDGTDVSWIWDVDFELLDGCKKNIVVSGDRALDMAVRMKYAITNAKCQMLNVFVEPNLKTALDEAILKTNANETLWILATYSAMLEIRKIITGKSIL